MTRRRLSPIRQSLMPESGPAAAPTPWAAKRRALAADMVISEWSGDLDTAPVATPVPAPTSVAAIGFVDFDALDSIHECRVVTTVGTRW